MNAQEQSHEVGTPEQDDSVKHLSDLESLGNALAEDEQPSGDDQGETSGSDEQSQPTRFNDLAGATDLELDALYKLTVSLDDDSEPVSIEQLKDSYKERNDFELERIRIEEQQAEDTKKLLRERSELQELLAALPANAVKPETLEKLRGQMEQRQTEERRQTLEVIPDWKDDEKRDRDIQAMTEHLQDYGFPPGQLGQMVDHRWLRYIRESMLRERRIKAALAKVKKASPGKAKSAAEPNKAPRKNAAPKINPKSGQSKLEALLTNTD